jgi:hypothetical protein
MMGDGEARQVVRAAFAKRGMDSPRLAELQAAQAIGRFEGRYGSWKAANNWGAIQCGAPPCPENCFGHGDTDAEGVAYAACFRIYATPVDGAADLVRELYRREGVPEAMEQGNADLIAHRMRATGYFEAPEKLYAKAIASNAKQIALNNGEPLRVVRAGDIKQPLPVELVDDDDGAGAGIGIFAAGFFVFAGVARAWINRGRH